MNKKTDSKLFYLAVGENIKKYREIRGYSLQALGEKIGVTKKTIQRYENGEIKIDMNRLHDISEALRIEMSKLLDGTQKFMGLDIATIHNINLPIVNELSYRNGAFIYEKIEDYESTPKQWLGKGEYFYLRAFGETMTGARITAGNLLLIHKQEAVEDKQTVVVMKQNILYVMHVYEHKGIIILQAENSCYPPVIYSNSDNSIKVVGRVERIVIEL